MSKPKFDPDQPFEAAKPKFDPDQPFEAGLDTSPLPRPETSIGGAVVRGAAQGATLGFADEATAAIGGFKDWLQGQMGQRGEIDLDDAYKSYIDHIRKADHQARADHPIAYGGAEIGGGIASSIIAPAINPAAAETALGRMGVAAATGGVTGAGHSEKSMTENPVGFGADVLLGASTGAATQGILDKAAPYAEKAIDKGGELLGKAGDKLKSAAERRAFKAAVGNQQQAFDEAAKRGLINDRGRELLDEGVVGFGTSAREIARRAKDKAKEAGAGIGKLLEGIDEDAPGLVSGESMAARLREHAGEVGGSGNKPLVKRLLEAADELEAKGNMSFADAAREKASWQWQPGDSLTKESARRIKSIIGGEMEEGVKRYEAQLAERAAASAPGEIAEEAAPQFGEVLRTGSGSSIQRGSQLEPVYMEGAAVAEGGADAAKRLEIYKALKSKYGTMEAASKDATKLANRLEKNQTVSLGDRLAAVGGAVAAGPKGILVGVGNHLVRKRGSSAAAVSLDKIGDMVKATPEFFGKYAQPLMEAAQRGNQSLAVTHYLLMQQDPDYQNLVGGKGEDVP